MKTYEFTINGIDCDVCANLLKQKVARNIGHLTGMHLDPFDHELEIESEDGLDARAVQLQINQWVDEVLVNHTHSLDGHGHSHEEHDHDHHHEHEHDHDHSHCSHEGCTCETVSEQPAHQKTTGEQVLYIDGLDCAACALKLEKAINKRDDVDHAVVSYVDGKVYLEMKDGTLSDAVLSDLEKQLQKLEPVTLRKEKQKPHLVKKTYLGLTFSIWQIIIGIVILAITYFFRDNLWILPFAIAGYLFVGYDVLLKAGRNILAKEIFDENFLMSIATIGAFFIQEYPEAIGVMLFYKVGEYFQDRAVDKSRESIQELMDIKPEFAQLKEGDTITKVDPNQVLLGDTIVVYPSQRIPLDGTILTGDSLLDMSSLTGESVPVEVYQSDKVLSGSINLKGTLEIRVDALYANSTVKKLMDLIENASLKKASTEKFITRFSRVYTPIVVALAVVVMIVVALVSGNFYTGLERALILLVISCPCALVISTPLGFFAGIGKSSTEGILVKGGQALEDLSKVTTMVFDKTGTLTKGNFAVVEVASVRQYSQDQILEYAAMVESQSEHPIARSIARAYAHPVDHSRIRNLSEQIGRGISADVDGLAIYVGNQRGLEERGVEPLSNPIDSTVVYVVINQVIEGYIVIEDEVKEQSQSTIASLKKRFNIKTIMLSGDKKNVADRIGQFLHLDEVRSELLPDQKVDAFEAIKSSTSESVAYVGDGMNDAAVLAMSDVGIAMGQFGNDLAIESADIILMNDDPSKIITAIDLSKRTVSIVRETIIVVMAVKIVIMILGIFSLASMWLAVFADVGVSLLAVLNAMRIMK